MKPNIQHYIEAWIGIFTAIVGGIFDSEKCMLFAIIATLFAGFRFVSDTILFVSEKETQNER